MTDAFSLRNCWRFGCELRLQMIQNQYKMVYYSSYCVFAPRIKSERHIPDYIGYIFMLKGLTVMLLFSTGHISNNYECKSFLFSGHPLGYYSRENIEILVQPLTCGPQFQVTKNCKLYC